MKFTKIYEGKNSTIYKGKYDNYDKDVIIKILNTEYPTEEQINRFNNEYEFTEELIIHGVRKALKKDKKDGKNSLILEYIEGQTLKNFISSNNFDIKSLIKIAVNISQTLGEIHQQNIIHKDINSNNILINEKNETKIIDFGLATKYTLKTQNLANPEHLEGTLTYISPEQTGRMNRSVDYRSDLYSLGIVLYEIFTKKLPFDDKDNMELIHSHIAKTPTPPNEIETPPIEDWEGIPIVLSNIILKLLSKNAEDRYQTAFGLKYDLDKLLESSNSFKLGEKDFSGRLIIPEKLYGREEEIKYIYEIYENICKGQTELLLVSGLSGVGKSALIYEIHKALTEKRGLYIEGKFDQFQKDIPYYAIIRAFTDFVNLILKESDKKLKYWENLIQKAVGDIGGVLTNLIPDLELIIGKQPELPKLEGKEAKNRFNYVWGNFVNAISTAEHPLIFFIDDLHRADNSSIELLKNLLSDFGIQYLFCITAYRDNEINITDLQTFENIDDLKINKIKLQNLNQNDVHNLVSDTLMTKNLAGLKDLSGLIYSKTLGNAFFTVQFFKNLYEEEFLKFDFTESVWKWNFEEIEKQNITDNVVELIANKVKKLPKATQDVLKIAACIGNRFDLKILSIIYKKEEKTGKKDLEPAIFENLVVPLDKQNFKFVHDRVQQAVYCTIPEQEKIDFHLQTGKLLLKFFDKENLQKQIFEVVNQLNYGKDFIDNKTEKQELAELNYHAGIKAKQSSAYLYAYNYLKISSNLLDKDSWQKKYKFTLKIYDELAELSYLSNNYDKTKEYVQLIKENAEDVLHIINSHYTLINSNRAQLKYKESLEIGLKLLSQLGLKIPINPSKLYIIKEFIQTQIVIAGKDTEFFMNLPVMTDKQQLARVKILDAIGTITYYGYPNLFPVICLKGIRTAVKHGNSMVTPLAFMGYAIVLSIMNKFNRAIEFAILAEKLLIKLNVVPQKAKIHYILHYFVLIWKNKLHSIIPAMENAYKIGMEIGDFEFAGYAIISTFLSIYSNTPLKQLQNKQIARINLVKRTNQRYPINFSPFSLQVFDNLISLSENACLLKGNYFNEDNEINKFIENKDRGNLIHYYSIKLLLCLVYNDLHLADKFLSGSEKYKDALRGNYYYAVGDLFRSLISLQIYDENKDQKLLKKVKKNQKRMKIWAKNNPINFQHKYDLVEAEIMRIHRKYEQAKELYDKAIFAAKENEFSSDEAISRQIAAQFYLKINKNHLGEFYMQDAYNCYKKWGAFGVCEHLEQKYPQFSLAQKSTISTSHSTLSKISGSSTTNVSSLLDLTSIVKASQSLSGEVKLENLLKNMLMIIMENAGADYAVIIKNDEGKYTIEAKGRHGQKNMDVLQSENLQKTEAVALNVVNYVIRTSKILVINNASKDEEFSKNDYIQKNKVKSVFCYPVVHKNKLVAVLYLENNLSTHVFTSERIETINILSSQIAVSIENALLYKNLEVKVKARTAEVVKQKQDIEEKNEELSHQKEELQRTLENLKLTQTQLVQSEKMASLGGLVAGVAHEINTPVGIGVTAISSLIEDTKRMAELYKKEEITRADFKEYLTSSNKSAKLIQKNLERTASLVQSFKQVSVDQSTEQQREFNFNSYMEDVIRSLYPKFKLRDININIDCDEELKLNSYPGVFAQIFTNLVLNSIAHGFKNEKKKGLIDILVKQEDEQLQIEYKDNGEGIPQEILPKIFDPFFTTEQSKGTGLGLNIVYNLVTQKLKGSIKCDSEEGKGVVFTIAIPTN